MSFFSSIARHKRCRNVQYILCAFMLVLILAGCSRFEPVRERRDHTESFTQALSELADKELFAPLALENCIEIALRNNYDIRKADLDRELFHIGKKVAFTAFLPNVAASAGYNSFLKDPQNTDQKFSSEELNITLPIFMPSSWFLYMSARHGYASADIAANYVRQGIVMQTTVNYFNLVVQEETVAALESQLAAAKELAERVEGLSDEGLITKWEGDQAAFMAYARETELSHAKRKLAVLRGELLRGMGLSPLAPLKISTEIQEHTRQETSAEDLVLKALEVNPQLSIADRQVVIKNHQVRQAFCNFLPTITLFHTGQWTGNDLAVHSENWISGFKGVWTIFDGLANVARYRAAKVEHRKSELERESTFLSVIVQVIAAEAAVRDASEAALLQQLAFDVASAKSEDYTAKAKEGLIPLSDALEAQSAKDLAQVALVKSKYQERIALANLDLAVGTTLLPLERPEERR